MNTNNVSFEKGSVRKSRLMVNILQFTEFIEIITCIIFLIP